MKRLTALAAALLWLVLLCAILAVTMPRGAVGSGVLSAQALGLVAALAIAVTLAAALSPLPPFAGYVAAHLAGVAVVITAVSWPQPPWTWRPPPELATLFSGGAGPPGPMMLALLSAGLAWELAYACAWLVLRDRRVWLALSLIVGTLAVSSPLQGRDRDPYLAALCLVGLMVVLVTAAVQRRLAVPRRVRTGLSLRLAPLLLVPLSGALVAAAWAAPVPSSATTAALRRADWGGALVYLLTQAGLNSGQVGDSTAGLSTFGSDLPVGGQFHPDGTPVLQARIADVARSPYWRGAVYDRYDAGNWRAVPGHRIAAAAQTALPVPSGAATVAPITQVVSLLQPSNTQFTAGLPLLVDLPALAIVADGGVPAGVLDLAPAHGPMSGEYVAASLPAAAALVNPAPALDPAVRALDLALPRGLPRRVRDLARRLTSGSADPYRQAWAIERYLRVDGRYVYDTAPPQAPAGQDPADYFLFTSRRGFCTHFATAMVVLARSAGIPARLVTGYAAGRLVGGWFLVTTADAHAWPELWIAGRGWLTFEPTPSFPTPFQVSGAPLGPSRATISVPPATRPAMAPASTTRRKGVRAVVPPTAGGKATPRAASGQRAAPGRQSQLRPEFLPRMVLALLVALALAYAVVLALLARPDALALYRRMCRLASFLRAGPRPGQTPLEWAAQVAARSPGDRAAVLAVTDLYVQQRYGGRHPAKRDMVAARAGWRRVRRRWWRLVLIRRAL